MREDKREDCRGWWDRSVGAVDPEVSQTVSSSLFSAIMSILIASLALGSIIN